MRAESNNTITLQEFKDLTRDQALMLTLDAPAAIQAMPRLLEGETPAAIRTALDEMKRVLEAAEPLSAAARESLDEMEHIFEAAARRAEHHGRDGAAPRNAAAPRKVAAARKTAAPARQRVKAAVADPAIEPPERREAGRQAHLRRDGPGRRNKREGLHEGCNQNRIEDHNPNRRQIGRPRKPANNKTKPQ